MNRREFLAASAAAIAAPRVGRSAQQPNILFILADDLGYGDLGCYGQQQILTPNLDRLAASGMRFTQAYAGSTVCAPSRCSLMTGYHTGHATIRGNKKPELGIKSSEVTVASLLKKSGYETALFGKWGMGGPATGSVPNTRGFDHFFGYLNQQHAHNYYPEHLWENQDEFFLTANWFDQRKQYAPDLFALRVLDFLKRPRRQPFFIYYTPTIPHANNELGQLKGNGMEVPDNSAYSSRDWPDTEKNFAAMVTRLDSDVGRILDQLKAAGQEQNTLVIFTSDNGPHKEGGRNPGFFRSSGPLRGIKRDLYEGGIRVPFIARWPGVVPAGSVSEQVIAFWDFLPTAAALCGSAAPQALDGSSFVDALSGKKQSSHAPLYWEFHEGRFAQAVRMEDWKGVRLNPGQPIELFDLAGDPGEKVDVSAKHADIVKRISGLLDSCRTESPDFPVSR